MISHIYHNMIKKLTSKSMYYHDSQITFSFNASRI